MANRGKSTGEPRPDSDPNRDAKGRFTKGNRAGRLFDTESGREAALKPRTTIMSVVSALLDENDGKERKEVARSLIKHFKKGNAAAIRELMGRDSGVLGAADDGFDPSDIIRVRPRKVLSFDEHTDADD